MWLDVGERLRSWGCNAVMQNSICIVAGNTEAFNTILRVRTCTLNGIVFIYKQWFPNCGTRTTSGARWPWRWMTLRNKPTFCFSSQKICSQLQFLLISLCQYILKYFVYHPCWLFKRPLWFLTAILVHVAFVSVLVFPTFDRMIFVRLSFPGTRWYLVTVGDP